MNIFEFNNLMTDIRKYDIESEILWFFAIENKSAVFVPVATNPIQTEFFDLRTGKFYSPNNITKKLQADYFLETEFCRASTKDLQQSLEEVCLLKADNKELFDLVENSCKKDKEIAFPVLSEKGKKVSKHKLIKKADALENIFSIVDNFQQNKDFESNTLSI